MTDRSDSVDTRPWTLAISDSWGRATSVDVTDGEYVVGADADCDIIVMAAGDDEAFVLALDGTTIRVSPKTSHTPDVPDGPDGGEPGADADDAAATYVGQADIRRANMRIQVTHKAAQHTGQDGAVAAGATAPLAARGDAGDGDERVRRRALMAGGLLLVVGLVLTVALSGGDQRRQALERVAAEQQRVMLTQALADRKLDAHTQLRPVAAGQWVAQRPLWRDEDIKALETVAHENGVALQFDGHRLGRVQKSITDLAEGLGVALQVSDDPSGTVVIAGMVASDAQRDKIRGLLAEDLAETVPYRVGELATTREATQELMRNVMQSDYYEQVVIEPGEASVVLRADRAVAEQPGLRRLVADFRHKYGDASLTVDSNLQQLAARPTVGIWDGNIQYMFVNEHEVFLGDNPAARRPGGAEPGGRKVIGPALAN